MTIDCVVNQPKDIFLDNIGASMTTAVTGTATAFLYRTLKDRLRLLPTSIGTYTLTVGGVSETINVVDDVSGGATTASGVFVGDSTTLATGHGGWVKFIKDYLNSRLTLLGSVATAGYNHEGYSGTTWAWHATNASSPFTSATDTLDIAAWETAIGATPDFIVFMLGINDFFSASTTGFDTTVATALGHADTLIAAIEAQMPSTQIFVGTPLPGNARTTGPTWSTNRADNKLKFQRAAKLYADHFSSARLIKTHVEIDPWRGYPTADAVHPNTAGAQGSEIVARNIRHSLAARVNVSGWAA